jgi:hypothetical protein
MYLALRFADKLQASQLPKRYVMDTSNSEYFPKKLKGILVLHAKEIVERVDEIFTAMAEDLVDYFFVIVANDLI